MNGPREMAAGKPSRDGLFIGITTFGGDGGKSGISQYIINLLAQFSAMDLPHRFEVILYEDERDIFLKRAPGLSALTKSASLRHPVVNLAWHQAALPILAARRKYDLLFLPAGNRRLPLVCPCPSVGTVHDFSSIHVQGKYDAARIFYIKKVLPFLIRRLDLVLTVSQASKDDIVHYGGVPDQKVLVTPLAADPARFRTGDKAALRRELSSLLGSEAPYILYISRIEHPGKNHVRLIEAFERFKEATALPHNLVLAGADRERAEEVHARARASAWSDSIRFTGFLQDEQLPGLYSGTDLFVFPSLYEGFGLPLLEAMASGAPVACSNLSSLPEVAGDAAQQFDPYDADDIALAMQRILEDSRQSTALIKQGLKRAAQFNWRRTARQTMDALEQAAGWTGDGQ